MIQTLETMRKNIMAWVPGFSPDAYDLAINRAYDDISKMYPWTRLEREFKVTTKTYVANGGAAFTNGAVTITAATSVSAAWTATANKFAGMFIKKNTDDQAAYYTITASTSVEITVTEAFQGITTTAVASAGDGYFIFKHLYTIDSTIETVTHMMGKSLLHEVDRLNVEMRNPDFDWEGEPSSWSNYGVNSANQCIVQIYPPKVDDVYELRGWGRLKVEALTSSASPLLDSNLIISFAAVELFRRKFLITPDSVTEGAVGLAEKTAEAKVLIAMQLDGRQRTHMPYTQDNMFRSGHPGQKWLVSHDPWDRF